MDLIEQGIQQNLISFDTDRQYITYTQLSKRYRFTDPEEPVRAASYLQLILVYGYAPNRIDVEYEVPRREKGDWADVVVCQDDERKAPYIVVECKKPDITDAEFLQAIEQGFGNANSLRSQYLWVTSGVLNEYFNVADFPQRERVENKLADLLHAGRDRLSQAKFYKGGINEFDDDAFDIAPVGEYELVNIFRKAHDALWSGGKRSPEQAFDELDKLIFCKIWDERLLRRNGDPYFFQVFTHETPEDLARRINGIYLQGRQKSPEVFREDIRLEPREMTRVVGYLAPVNMRETDLDSKGRAFETFLDSFFRGKFGQYFTPRPIVDFIIDVLPITNESVVLDPACGSGGFLLYALDKIRQQADQLAAEGYFALGSREHYEYWHKFAEHNLFGIEINESIARTAKMNMIIHDDGHTNVIAYDGLENVENIGDFARHNGSIDYEKFDHDTVDDIGTNPPFGSSVYLSERRYVEDYDLGFKNVDWILTHLRQRGNPDPRDNQKTEILYIEQCYTYLKPGGYLGIVLPDGILTNSTLQYVRDWIEDHFRIVGVVSMPQTAFTATGAGVKSSVLFLRKYDLATVEAIKATKETLQGQLFREKQFGPRLRALEAESKKTIKSGDAHIRKIKDDLDVRLQALRDQGTLDESTQNELERQAQAQDRAYRKTDVFKTWEKDAKADYKDRVDAVKEALQEAFIERVRQELADYPIFMAIAEDIGYDATGRPTGNNELPVIAEELKRFIAAIETGQDRFFVSSPV